MNNGTIAMDNEKHHTIRGKSIKDEFPTCIFLIAFPVRHWDSREGVYRYRFKYAGIYDSKNH